MKMRIAVLSLLCVSICAGSVLAGEGEEGARKGRQGNGAERFKAADTDGDGSLSLAEFTAVHAKRVEAMKAKIQEKRGEGKGKRGERPEGEGAAKPSVEAIFAKLDTDNSGGLSPAEMKEGHKRMKQRRQNGGCKCGGKGKPGKAADETPEAEVEQVD